MVTVFTVKDGTHETFTNRSLVKSSGNEKALKESVPDSKPKKRREVKDGR